MPVLAVKPEGTEFCLAWYDRPNDTNNAFLESPLFYAQGTDPYSEPPRLPAPLIGLESFSLLPIIPEPSASALLALGGAVLWWSRRRSSPR